MDKQVKSRQRVIEHGEVFTAQREVKSMVNLLQKEVEQINSICLEPACGEGAFLCEILYRKLSLCNSDTDRFEAVKSIYGIDILEDNVEICRENLFEIWKAADGNEDSQEAVKEILKRNIIHGDALKYFDEMLTVEQDMFAERTETMINVDDLKNKLTIISNPPYQEKDGGAHASATPVYQHFVEAAIKLNPNYVSMIIPAKWYTGGKGLSKFRNDMLNDHHITYLVDYFDSKDCFKNVDISGGVCYFIWDKNHDGPCTVVNHFNGKTSKMVRYLLPEGMDTFIRFNEAVSIVEKVRAKGEKSFADDVSSRKPFGFDTKPKGLHFEPQDDSVKIYAYPKDGFINKNAISKNIEWLPKYKVCIAYAYGERGKFPYNVIAKPFIAEPNSCCSETYIVIRAVDNRAEAENIISYMSTRFFRFLVLQKKNTQHATQKVYEFVPTQDFSKSWTDEELYKKYGLTDSEIEFIESLVKPMNN